MRIALMADVHDDETAMSTVCEKVKGTVDQVWFLGDLVGYGVYSENTLKLLHHTVSHWVTGNHEEMLKVVINSLRNPGYKLKGASFFEVYQRICDRWEAKENLSAIEDVYLLAKAILDEFRRLEINYQTRIEVVQTLLMDCVVAAGRNLLDPEALDREWRGEWKWFASEIQLPAHQPVQVVDAEDGWRMALSHGSLASANEYIYPWSGHPWNSQDLVVERIWADLMDRIRQLRLPDKRLLVLLGHSHIPLYCPIQDDTDLVRLDATRMVYDQPLPLGEWATIINPGSVGHPRDMDPRVAYAVVDTRAATITYHRLKIDRSIELSQMRHNYLPASLQMEYRDATPPVDDAEKLAILQQRLTV
jgi:predicted phosphodiesterase